jgi:hypothetical protein
VLNPIKAPPLCAALVHLANVGDAKRWPLKICFEYVVISPFTDVSYGSIASTWGPTALFDITYRSVAEFWRVQLLHLANRTLRN